MKWNECNLIAFGFVLGGVTAGTYGAVFHLNSKLFLGTDGRLQWETLVTGIGAVVAAFFTVRHLREQISQSQKLADDQRQRRARAACATLPLALSQLAQYATSCIRGLYDLRPYFRTPSSVNDLAQRAQKCAAWELPLLSDNVFNSLKECIEVIDNEPAQSIIQLIGHTQIQRSRLEEYISRERLNDATHLVVLSNIEHAMYDAAEIHARTSTLFPFSRGYTAGSLAVTRERIYEALSLSGCFNDYSEISALADKWKRETLARETFRQKISVSGDPNGIDV